MVLSSSSAFDDDDDDDDDDVSLLLSKSVSSSSPLLLFFFESATKRILFRRPRFLRPRSKRVVVARVERRTKLFEKVEEEDDDDDDNHGAERTAPPPTRTVKEDVMFSRERDDYALSSVCRQSFSDDLDAEVSRSVFSQSSALLFRDAIQVRREEDGLFPKTMLRTRTKSNTNDDTIRGGESGSALRGSKGKHHSQQQKKKHILNLCIGFAIVFILGAFFSLFVYDIEDLEEASAVSFRDDGKGTLDDERKKKKKRRNHEEKETEEAHSTRRRGSQVGSAVTPNSRFDVRSSFAQSFAALSKGENGGSFPYRYVFALLLFARLCRVFQ